jgi:HSP20 family molecular chaperone IbpA
VNNPAKVVNGGFGADVGFQAEADRASLTPERLPSVLLEAEAPSKILSQVESLLVANCPVEEADWLPSADILEDSEEYLIKLDLPAVKWGDIQIKVESNGLMISGDRAKPWQESRRYLRLERPAGHFERRFPLPGDASRIDISAEFAESVLEVHVRKERPFLRTTTATERPASSNELGVVSSCSRQNSHVARSLA